MGQPTILYKDGSEMIVYGAAQLQQAIDQGWTTEPPAPAAKPAAPKKSSRKKPAAKGK